MDFGGCRLEGSLLGLPLFNRIFFPTFCDSDLLCFCKDYHIYELLLTCIRLSTFQLAPSAASFARSSGSTRLRDSSFLSDIVEQSRSLTRYLYVFLLRSANGENKVHKRAIWPT